MQNWRRLRGELQAYAALRGRSAVSLADFLHDQGLELEDIYRAGVLPLTERKIEILFVTLDKSAGYHDRIAYHDYAISKERFHWQSQNSAGPDTAAGRRYLESPANGWRFQLFVRSRKGRPYRACGPVTLESAAGDRPLSIFWRLRVPLPIRLFREFSVLRGI